MRSSPVVLEKFGGMRYQSAFDEAIEDNDLLDALNVIVDEEGVIKRRQGFDQVQSVSGVTTFATILGRHETSTLSHMYVQSAGGVSLINQVGSTTVWTESGLVNAKAMAQYAGNAFIFSYQTQQMMKVDSLGNRTTNFANVQASGVVAHKARLFTWNIFTGTIDQLRYSQLYTDPTNPNFSGAGAWPAANTLDVASGDGEPITAVVEYNDNLIIFKKTSTWLLFTDGSPLTAWKLQKIHDSIGCVAQFSPKVIGSLLYFVSTDGVYRTDGTTFEEISRPIAQVWRGFAHNNASVTYERYGIEWNGLYIVSMDRSDNEWGVFNTKNDTWTRWDTPQNFSMAIAFPEQPLRPLRAMKYGNVSAELHEVNDGSGYQDNEGGAITSYDSVAVFKRFDFGQPDQWKNIPSINVAITRKFESAETTALVEAEIEIDARNAAPISRLLNLAVEDTDKNWLYRFKGPGRCRYMQLTLSTSAKNEMGITKIAYNMLKSTTVGRAHGA